jgi:transposase-like protein
MSSSKRSRRHFTTEQKVAILKRHMVDKVPVSDLCNEENLQPSVFYTWQRQALENLAGAFSTPEWRQLLWVRLFHDAARREELRSLDESQTRPRGH